MEQQHDVRNAQAYQRIAKAIRFICEHRTSQPSLKDIAQAVDLSPSHLQRMFVEWAGISPKRFLQVLNTNHARQLLARQQSTLDVTYELGLSSPSRLHDLLITCEALTPSQIRKQGEGITIEYGWADTPFGWAMIAWTKIGVCFLSFEDYPEPEEGPTPELRQYLPKAQLQQNTRHAQALARKIFRQSQGNHSEPSRIHLLLKGTGFQIKVWEALIRLGQKPLISYGQLASAIGKPSATRAVATAVASNNIAWLIPCHRVILQQGEFGQYRWSSTRKQSMLAWELARHVDGQADFSQSSQTMTAIGHDTFKA